MRSSRSSVVAVTVAALLALPAPVLAQSAGDEQYADPFQGTTESGGSRDRQRGTNQRVQSDSPASGQAGAGQSPAAGQEQATPSQSQRLPYTGPRSLLWLAVIGVALLGLGFALRRLARPAYRMFY